MKNIWVGVSGGVDSMSLLFFLKRDRALNVKALYFHHGNTYSERVMNLVSSYTKELKVPLQIGFIKPNNNPTEDYWRKERYNFFDSIVKEDEELLIAHHKDDQWVSYLLNSLKNSKRGFIPPVSIRDKRYYLYRPFHLISKREIIEYAERYRIPYLEDPTNRDSQRGEMEALLPKFREIIPQFEGGTARKYKAYLEKNNILEVKYAPTTNRICF